MGTVALVGTKNTLYVTTPDTITITPSNINSYLSSIYTPRITTKNAVSATVTRYFHVYGATYNSEWGASPEMFLGTWSAKLTKGSKTATNVTALTSNPDQNIKRQRLGSIPEKRCDYSVIVNRIYIEESTTTSDVDTFTKGSTACSIKYSGFNPPASTLSLAQTFTSTLNSQFGRVKGFCSGTFTGSVTQAGIMWTYTPTSGGSGIPYNGKIYPTTTLKQTAAGKTSSKGPYSTTLNSGTINNTSVTQTLTVSNVFGGSTSKTTTLAIQDYTKPQLSNIKVDRSGTNAVITLNWSVAQVNKSSNVTSSITVGTVKVDWTATANTTDAPTWSGTEIIAADGSAMSAITGALSITDSAHTYDTETSYTFTFKLTDRLGQSTMVTMVLPTKFYTIDFKSGGQGVAFGRVATMDNAVVFDTSMRPRVLGGKQDVDTFYRSKREDTGTEVAFGVGTGGNNHGIHSNSNDHWIIYDDENGVTRIPNTDIRLAGHSSSIGTVLNSYLANAKNVPNGTSSSTPLCSLSIPAGIWVITVGARFPSNTSGYRVLNLSATSGVTNWDLTAVPPATTMQMERTYIFTISSTTTYYLNVMQTSGTTLSCPASGSGYGNFIRAVRIL